MQARFVRPLLAVGLPPAECLSQNSDRVELWGSKVRGSVVTSRVHPQRGEHEREESEDSRRRRRRPADADRPRSLPRSQPGQGEGSGGQTDEREGGYPAIRRRRRLRRGGALRHGALPNVADPRAHPSGLPQSARRRPGGLRIGSLRRCRFVQGHGLDLYRSRGLRCVVEPPAGRRIGLCGERRRMVQRRPGLEIQGSGHGGALPADALHAGDRHSSSTRPPKWWSAHSPASQSACCRR